MTRLASRYLCPSLVGVVLLAGCASLPAPQSHDRAGSRYERIRDSLRLVNSLEDDEVASAPRIRLVVPPVSYAGSQYVEASFQLSADAYVLVVAVDLDRRIRVLYPETPEESGFAARSSPHRLTRFFAGFSRSNRSSGYDARYGMTGRISPVGGGGVLLAVASDRPLQLERLTGVGGDWDEPTLMQLIFDESLSGAAHAVGRAVVLTGQDFNTDYSTFSGRRSLTAYRSFASSSFGGCGDGYGYEYADVSGFGTSSYPNGYAGQAPRLIGLYQRNGQTFARYASGGGCGGVSYYDVPVNSTGPVLGAPVRADTSTAKRRPRFPGAPRFPIVSGDSGTGALARRLAPADAPDRGADRPLMASGLRFRPPEQLPGERLRPIEALMAPRDAGEFPARRRPVFSDEQASRRDAPQSAGREGERQAERMQPRERQSEPRAEPTRAEPMRAEPMRSEPPRMEPPRAEPVRSEPVRSEPVRSEPAPAPVRPPTLH
ncbi:MAG TPA: hypothetical protein VM033_05705 [Gemmatimonadaceae bacterium]|nr:hypothetical protein [Gemmatimonadaceae bacterium]